MPSRNRCSSFRSSPRLWSQAPICRFELDAFLARENELGRNDLVFPVLYIDVPGLDDSVRRQEIIPSFRSSPGANTWIGVNSVTRMCAQPM